MKSLTNFFANTESPVAVTSLLLMTLIPAFSAPLQAESRSLQLVELYTSHGCSSCPSADRLLGEFLAENENLLALEFHVDYWNSLVHGSDGSFTDPFSDPVFSARQREYSAAGLKGRPGVYTPQAVINGRFATVGSNRRHIEKALRRHIEQVFDIMVMPEAASGRLRVTLTASDDQRRELSGVSVVLVRYIDKASTLITGGENRNKVLENRHIVTDLQTIGRVMPVGDLVFNIATPPPGQGCVVLVQEAVLTPVYAAAACP